ncbi:hypothetical protein NLG97_g6950 [Lecanicillium saksenae]|uniref:Uncharacterized protein n=1 Tax=Lecanicillium saksenae TaxID=468837 RepID=A0ACC1QQR4_9HYPO|nr:hypothetical protein NLG97_g6950 [Lecanicillium saksenae]
MAPMAMAGRRGGAMTTLVRSAALSSGSGAALRRNRITTSTYRTLLHNVPAADDIWKYEVPKLAFAGKTYLADAILAISALHLRSLNPDDKTLAQASHAYSASALADYCSSLAGGIQEENAEALFLTACLIAFQATASRIFIKDDGEMTPSTGRNSSSGF